VTGTAKAVESFSVFLLTNVLAHAATVSLPAGANARRTAWVIFGAIAWPVIAGNIAIMRLTRWFKGSSSRQTWTGKRHDTMEDASVAGAVAIFIPRCLAPLLVDKWDVVGWTQHCLLLDHQRYPPYNPHGPTRSQWPLVCQYYQFILPPNTKFPGYSNHKFYPASSVLRQAIAVFQIVFSSVNLYTTYWQRVRQGGLSSAFLIAIPYILMSLVNLVTSLLISVYSHVIVLPMAEDVLPGINQERIPEYRNRRSTLHYERYFPSSALSVALSRRRMKRPPALALVETAALSRFQPCELTGGAIVPMLSPVRGPAPIPEHEPEILGARASNAEGEAIGQQGFQPLELTHEVFGPHRSANVMRVEIFPSSENLYEFALKLKPPTMTENAFKNKLIQDLTDYYRTGKKPMRAEGQVSSRQNLSGDGPSTDLSDLRFGLSGNGRPGSPEPDYLGTADKNVDPKGEIERQDLRREDDSNTVGSDENMPIVTPPVTIF
jgi:hypothetical protein